MLRDIKIVFHSHRIYLSYVVLCVRYQLIAASCTLVSLSLSISIHLIPLSPSLAL
jgi:cytochrome c biogenesis factor